MTKKKLVISPCGTSILTNSASTEERKILIKNANKKESQISKEDMKIISSRIAKIKEEVKNYSLEDAKRKSAELNSLIQYYHNKLSQPQDHHILIKTDTYLGGQTAQIIQQYLQQNGINVEILDIDDLQTEDLNSFQFALSEIVRDFNERLVGYKQQNYEVIFNLTGGFKSIQGFLQVLAMFYADKTIYIFESGTEILEIPRIPVKADEVEVFEENLTAFRRISCGCSDINIMAIPKIFLLEIDGELTLSPWGEIAWKNAKNIIYEKKLFKPPTKKIKYSNNFIKNIKNLQPNRVKELNEKIDDLFYYLETKQHLKSLTFKPISKGAKDKSTHEIYANSDEAKRIYCHYEGKVIVLDEYGKHL